MPQKIMVKFADVPDVGFSLLPIGRYPLLMHIDAYQHDAQGALAKDGEGNPVYWSNSSGDPWWKVKNDILDPKFKDKEIEDNFFFSEGGLKRMKHIFVRGGFVDENENSELKPDDLDGTYWWGETEHEVSMEKGTKTPQTSKYTFKANGCSCKVCKQYDGKDVYVKTKVSFAGYTPMTASEAKKYSQGGGAEASANGTCADCQKGQHIHTQDKAGCTCQDPTHPPF